MRSRLALALFGLALFVSSPSSAGGLAYQLASRITVPFGKANEFYILDTADIDGDGVDDFAISAMTTGGNFVGGVAKPGAKVHSFVVRNDATTGKLELTDLGPDGLTWRTWAGKFVRNPVDGAIYLVLGRNGELGLPETNLGELTSVFKLAMDGGKLTATSAFVGAHQGNTTSVDACDVDGDGRPDILVNNYNTPQSDDGPNHPRMIEIGADGAFTETMPDAWLPWLSDHGAHNVIRLVDVDGDGRCDLLAALEVAKWGAPGDSAATFPGDDASYLLLNAGGKFSTTPIKLDNPHYADDSTAMGIAVVESSGQRYVLVDAAQFKNHITPWKGFFMQAYAWGNGRLSEVTNTLLVGQLPEQTASGKRIWLNDIDHDGDQDVYLSQYDGSVDIYRNDGGKFTRVRVLSSSNNGTIAVAFLNDPKRPCSDMVVLRRDSTLERYVCK